MSSLERGLTQGWQARACMHRKSTEKVAGISKVRGSSHVGGIQPTSLQGHGQEVAPRKVVLIFWKGKGKTGWNQEAGRHLVCVCVCVCACVRACVKEGSPVWVCWYQQQGSHPTTLFVFVTFLLQ